MSNMRFEDELGMDIRNTESMRMDPQRNKPVHMLDEPTTGHGGIGLMMTVTGERFKDLVAYPVIVEMWDKLKLGRYRRERAKAFTDAEWNTVSRYYGRFYKWHLVSGTPDMVVCRAKTLDLLRRAAAWFASV